MRGVGGQMGRLVNGDWHRAAAVGGRGPTMVACGAVRIRRCVLDTVVKPSSLGAKRVMVEDEEATPRGSAE